MINMNFKDWYNTLQEAGTGTNCVAGFAQPIFGGHMVSRLFPQLWGSDDKPRKKKKKKKKKEED